MIYGCNENIKNSVEKNTTGVFDSYGMPGILKIGMRREELNRIDIDKKINKSYEYDSVYMEKVNVEAFFNNDIVIRFKMRMSSQNLNREYQYIFRIKNKLIFIDKNTKLKNFLNKNSGFFDLVRTAGNEKICLSKDDRIMIFFVDDSVVFIEILEKTGVNIRKIL
jgi:hypothetical protein